MKQKIKELEELARNFVGDGKGPNLFFVTIGGVVVTITRNFEAAYTEWKDLPRDIETGLEDRKWGTICYTAPEEEGSKQLWTTDDAWQFRKQFRLEAA